MDIVKGNMGWIEVVVGPMFSGKSEELIRRLRRAEIARQRVQIFKPAIDERYAANEIVSHSGLGIPSDNVFKAADVTGTARYISDVDKVMEMLTGGVPENTVAIIDDSGGTLTAPILGDFTAVVCMGGTVRSHLGILTREYNVPCLMNATLDGLADGDEVTVEYSKPAADAYADAEAASDHRARIIKVS